VLYSHNNVRRLFVSVSGACQSRPAAALFSRVIAIACCPTPQDKLLVLLKARVAPLANGSAACLLKRSLNNGCKQMNADLEGLLVKRYHFALCTVYLSVLSFFYERLCIKSPEATPKSSKNN